MTGSAAWVNQPDAIARGALVGVRGLPPDVSPAAGMIPGDKGCLIVDAGVEPDPPDLFKAQLELRLKRDVCSIVGCMP